MENCSEDMGGDEFRDWHEANEQSVKQEEWNNKFKETNGVMWRKQGDKGGGKLSRGERK